MLSLEALETKVYYLEKIVLNGCPISKIALEKQWDRQKEELIWRIFDKYFERCNQGDYNFTYRDVENDFEAIGIDRHDLKSIIPAFKEMGRYENVIGHYLVTNKNDFENVSSEFNGIVG